MSFLKRAITVSLIIVTVLLAINRTSGAQWLNHLDRTIPRTPDGKPDLTAPAPRTPAGVPDLSGIWRISARRIPLPGQSAVSLAAEGIDVPFQVAAEALYNQRVDNQRKEIPSAQCLPHGVPGSMLIGNLPFKILQTPGLAVILYEEFLDWRQIFTDGREFPKEPNPSWFGYSVGHWVQDTLIVTTIGFNDRTWLDLDGHPHSDALRITEAFHRQDFGHMEVEVTIDDAKMYTKPWIVSLPFDLIPDTELMEYVCENERDAAHLVGK
jgi:hypothetical protein